MNRRGFFKLISGMAGLGVCASLGIKDKASLFDTNHELNWSDSFQDIDIGPKWNSTCDNAVTICYNEDGTISVYTPESYSLEQRNRLMGITNDR